MAKPGFSHYQSYTTLKNNRRKFFKALRLVLYVYLGFLLLQQVLVHTVRLDNSSMEPTMASGTAVLVTPLPLGASLPFLPFGFPGWRDPERGEVVELIPAYHQNVSSFTGSLDDLLRFFSFNFFSLDETLRKDWDRPLTVKRIIGLPGDRVRIEDLVAYVKPRDQEYPLSEFELSKRIYNIKKDPLPEGWNKSYPFSQSMEEITLGEDEYFILADNRSSSGDSRAWGPVKKEAIRGSVVFKYWPFSAWGGL